MNKILIAAFVLVLAGCFAVQASQPHAAAVAPSTGAAQELPVPASFDIEMPAVQEPLDNTPVTPTETVGASQHE